MLWELRGERVKYFMKFLFLKVKSLAITYALVTCTKLFQNYFTLSRHPSEIILPKIISKLFQRFIAAHEYFPTCSMSLK